MRVATVTSGVEPDADGYAVRVDAGSPVSVRDGSPAVFSAVATGTHHVTLGGVASNCAVSGGADATVGVRADEESAVSFTVSCTAAHGSLAITVSTTGTLPDTDGYQLTIDGGAATVALPANGSATLDGLAAGTHVIAVDGRAMNCDLAPSTPTTAQVTAGQATPVAVSVSCDLGRIAYGAPSQTVGVPIEDMIFLINPDGTGRFQVTQYDGFSSSSAAWSPDHKTLAFIYVKQPYDPANPPAVLGFVNVDGTGRRFLDASLDAGAPLAWSPDGQNVAYTTAAGMTSIAVVGVDGSGKRVLPHGGQYAWAPAWSPDGRFIVFSTKPTDGGGADLFVINADGTGERQLTASRDEAVVSSCGWSPDGTRIVFANAAGKVVVINVDGSGRQALTAGGTDAYDVDPCWSPDGTRIVFSRGPFAQSESKYTVYTMNADGSGAAAIPRAMAGASHPVWW